MIEIGQEMKSLHTDKQMDGQKETDKAKSSLELYAQVS